MKKNKLSAPEKNKIVCRSRFRITVGSEIALGPGKVDLLEAIEKKGSISGAARDMGLSYRRAWQMVNAMNTCFQSPLVECSKGGKGGGGAKVTKVGQRVTELYRAMESKAKKAAQAEWSGIRKFL